MSYRRADPFVAPHLTIEVPERMSARGEVLTAFDDRAARRIARRLASVQPEAVANPVFSSFLRQSGPRGASGPGVRARVPGHTDLPVQRESPAMREYGRAVTTAVSAYVGPAMDRYLRRLGSARLASA